MAHDAPATSRRTVPAVQWIVLAAVGIAIGVAAASFAWQPPPQPKGTVIASFSGVLGQACPAPGVFCRVVNFTTPGSPGQFRSVELTMLFNVSCGAACSYEIESDVGDSGPSCRCPWGGGGLLNWSTSWVGVLPSGPGWVLVTENSFCPPSGCIPFPLGVVVALLDEGSSAGPPT